MKALSATLLLALAAGPLAAPAPRPTPPRKAPVAPPRAGDAARCGRPKRRSRPAGARKARVCSARPPTRSTPCAPCFGSRSWRRRTATRRAPRRACGARWSSRRTRKTCSGPRPGRRCPCARSGTRHPRPRSAHAHEPHGVAVPLPARGGPHAGGRHAGGGGSPAAIETPSRTARSPSSPSGSPTTAAGVTEAKERPVARPRPRARQRGGHGRPGGSRRRDLARRKTRGTTRKRRWPGPRATPPRTWCMGLVLMKQERYAEARDAFLEGRRRRARVGQGPLPAEPGLRPPGRRSPRPRAPRELPAQAEGDRGSRARTARPFRVSDGGGSERRPAGARSSCSWARRRSAQSPPAAPQLLFRDIRAEAGHHLHAPRRAREEVHRRVDERRGGAVRLRQRRPRRHLLRGLAHRRHRAATRAPRAARSIGTWATGKFEDVTDKAGVGHPGWGMGVCTADVGRRRLARTSTSPRLGREPPVPQQRRRHLHRHRGEGGRHRRRLVRRAAASPTTTATATSTSS